jgi:hypothetical protein
MRVLSASWDNQADITKITFNEDFKNSDWLVKLDVLSDLIISLEDKYNKIISIKDWDERNKFNLSEEK